MGAQWYEAARAWFNYDRINRTIESQLVAGPISIRKYRISDYGYYNTAKRTYPRYPFRRRVFWNGTTNRGCGRITAPTYHRSDESSVMACPHRPMAETEVKVLLIEPKGEPNSGDSDREAAPKTRI